MELYNEPFLGPIPFLSFSIPTRRGLLSAESQFQFLQVLHTMVHTWYHPENRDRSAQFPRRLADRSNRHVLELVNFVHVYIHIKKISVQCPAFSSIAAQLFPCLLLLLLRQGLSVNPEPIGSYRRAGQLTPGILSGPAPSCPTPPHLGSQMCLQQCLDFYACTGDLHPGPLLVQQVFTGKPSPLQ